MKPVAIVALVASLSAGTVAQEKPVPKDSIRISIPGCSKGQMFTVTASPEHESRSTVEPGRRFRLAGPKAILNEIKEREGSMIEVTGLVRKGQVDQRGVAIGDNVRVRPGGAPVAGNPGSIGRDPNYDQVILDVEGWRQLVGECPRKKAP